MPLATTQHETFTPHLVFTRVVTIEGVSVTAIHGLGHRVNAVSNAPASTAILRVIAKAIRATALAISRRNRHFAIPSVVTNFAHRGDEQAAANFLPLVTMKMIETVQ